MRTDNKYHYPPSRDWIAKALEDIRKETQQLAGSVIGSVQSQVTQLQSVTAIEYAEFTSSVSSFTGWRDSVSVNVTSESGRVEISFGGSLNGGSGYFCYQIEQNGSMTVTRDSVQANPARRVAVTGGASFSPSGYSHQIVDVTPGIPATITLELYATDNFVTFFGGSLLARAAL